MSSDDGIEPALVGELLAAETREQQARSLRDAGLLDADGLDRLLDVAERLVNEDLGRAERLAEFCGGLAEAARAPAAIPRANYIRAGVHNLNGEFEEDLRLTGAAHDGYVALGMNLEAVRTNVGKMVALLELGRYQEALDAGRIVTDTLDGRGQLAVKPSLQESRLLTAMVNQNRGRCLEYMGHYDEALAAYDQAGELYETLGMIERLGQVIDNKGSVLSTLGRGNEALKAHESAAEIFEAAKLPLSQVMALGNLGETHLRLANYMKGLRAFERARRLVGSLGNPADEYLLLRDTADAYLSLNLYAEALTAYREADVLLGDAGMSHDRARALWGMGSCLIARSELAEAEEVLEESARLFAAAGNGPMLSGVLLEQASVFAARGDRTAALATARRSLEIVRTDAWPVQQIHARLHLADLLLPDTAAVESQLLAAQPLVDRVALPQLDYRWKERLGNLRRLQDRNEEARALLEASAAEIEHLRGAVDRDAMRTSFLQDKTAAYEGLLQLHLAREDEEGTRSAFAAAERSKSRALVDLLTGVAEREMGGTGDPHLEERARALQADLNAIYGELLGSASHGGEDATRLPNLHARAVGLEQEISRLRLQGAAAGPPHDVFTAPTRPINVRDRIGDGTTLIAYHVIGDEVLAFVGLGEHIRVVRELVTVSEVNRSLHKLDIQLERFRAGKGFADRHIARMERSARQALATLYDGLIAPLEPLTEGRAPTSQLTIVPHGPLHRVPFHALFDGERYLIERSEVSSAPSATVYTLCQERTSRGRDRAAVFGVQDASIPLAAAEAYAVARRLPGAEVRVGEDATIEALQDGAPESGTLHLACHGLFRSDNPMFSALKLHDGWLVAADAMSLDLPGSLVTLSACESGRGEVIGGDEVLGLTRAFLGAGAATLVVSLWLVQDETTAELMGDYYERLRDGARPVEALRDAQLELKERYAHPYYWAPFVLIGKR